MRILVTGGAGFIGSSLALSFKKEDPAAVVVAVDNLKRRGAELNLNLFKHAGVQFVHGDIRNQSDRRWIAWARAIVSRHDYSKALKRENVPDKEGN